MKKALSYRDSKCHRDREEPSDVSEDFIDAAGLNHGRSSGKPSLPVGWTRRSKGIYASLWRSLRYHYLWCINYERRRLEKGKVRIYTRWQSCGLCEMRYWQGLAPIPRKSNTLYRDRLYYPISSHRIIEWEREWKRLKKRLTSNVQCVVFP